MLFEWSLHVLTFLFVLLCFTPFRIAWPGWPIEGHSGGPQPGLPLDPSMGPARPSRKERRKRRTNAEHIRNAKTIRKHNVKKLTALSAFCVFNKHTENAKGIQLCPPCLFCGWPLHVLSCSPLFFVVVSAFSHCLAWLAHRGT